MLFEIDHRSGIPIYRQIMDQVTEQILSGLLKEGAQVMTVRELAATLNINPMTVSKAYSFMEAEGLLERRRGIGLFVAKFRADQKLQAREAALEALLARAVTMAVQYDISKEGAKQILDKLYEKHAAEKRRASNE